MPPPQELALNKTLCLEIINRAGAADNFAGAYLVSEWYRRHRCLYSQVQKNMTPADDKARMLAGAGHAAMRQEFIKPDALFRLKTLQQVLQ